MTDSISITVPAWSNLPHIATFNKQLKAVHRCGLLCLEWLEEATIRLTEHISAVGDSEQIVDLANG